MAVRLIAIDIDGTLLDSRWRLPEANGKAIAEAIERGDCDAVAIARGFVANPDLVRLFEQGHDRPPRPCTHCNKCLVNFIENPLGCYEESRYESREEMIREIYSVFEPPDRSVVVSG